jgi:NAD(P)-dependent dehydrogenase (short-subunit alcohol dehydrogenase family)
MNNALSAFFYNAIERYGKVDILVNNAAVDDESGNDTIEKITKNVIDLLKKAGTLRFNNELYPPDALNGKETIGGITVRCLTAEAQLLYHQGYEHTEIPCFVSLASLLTSLGILLCAACLLFRLGTEQSFMDCRQGGSLRRRRGGRGSSSRGKTRAHSTHCSTNCRHETRGKSLK